MTSSAKSIVITGADSAFFPWLADLIFSIEDCDVLSLADFGVLDLGLGQKQREWLSMRDIQSVKVLSSSLEVPEPIAHLPAILARTERPFLRDHFPGYANYLWVDADVWLQSNVAVAGALYVAQQGFIGMASHNDRCYLGNRSGARQWKHRRLKFAFGETVAERYIDWVGFNSGLLSLPAKLPIWEIWANAQQDILHEGGERLIERPELFSDQTVLNFLIWKHGLAVNPLPANFNWLCHLAHPLRAKDTGKWVEPNWPHQLLHAIHLSGGTNRSFLEGRFRRDPERHVLPSPDDHE